jgi:transcriptional regulator NrdR family protein
MLHCPECQKNTHVTASRDWGHGRLYRNRECVQCGHAFVTIELALGPRPNLGRRLWSKDCVLPIIERMQAEIIEAVEKDADRAMDEGGHYGDDVYGDAY